MRQNYVMTDNGQLTDFQLAELSLNSDTLHAQVIAAMLAPPIRNDQFEVGFGTLYTAEYQPAAKVATWHWLETSWTRGFDDPDDIREVRLA